MIKPEAKLENWCVVLLGDSTRYMGESKGHPRYPDGTPLCTTETAKIHEDGRIETRNSIYTLGKHDPELQAKMDAVGLKVAFD